jgi:hypothetical protein
MSNKRESWGVLNDGSQRFKDTVIKYLNEESIDMFNGGNASWYYGVNNIGEYSTHEKSNMFDVILTIDEFCETFLKKKEKTDLTKWRENAEKDYKTTPISVLRYISELEKLVNNGNK